MAHTVCSKPKRGEEGEVTKGNDPQAEKDSFCFFNLLIIIFFSFCFLQTGSSVPQTGLELLVLGRTSFPSCVLGLQVITLGPPPVPFALEQNKEDSLLSHPLTSSFPFTASFPPGHLWAPSLASPTLHNLALFSLQPWLEIMCLC